MSYWDEDANYLREAAEELPQHRRRFLDIARDLEKSTPDGEFLEQLAGKIEGWVQERVLPTPGFAEELGENLRSLALMLRRHPSQ
jgi:hypothetical protein